LAPAAVTSLGEAMQLLASNAVPFLMRTSSACLAFFALSLFACQGGTSPQVPENGGQGGDGGTNGAVDTGGNAGDAAGQGGDAVEEPVPKAADTGLMAPLRRLNKQQYDNAVFDLTGLFGDYSEGFVADEEQAGFLSNSRAPAKELQLENYQRSAEDIGDGVVSNLSRLVPCAPPVMAEAACLSSFLKTFGMRAYRRPLEAQEIAAYEKLFQTGKSADGKFATGIAGVVSAMMQSPNFLYRVERGGPRTAGAPVMLTDYEVASRLSFMLFNGPPDEELYAAAEAGRLREAQGVGEQAQRMLNLRKTKKGVAAFASQWLHVSANGELAKDAAAYPAFSEELAADMFEEFDELADESFRGFGGSLASLLTGNASYVKRGLYALYGLPTPRFDTALASLRRVDLPAGQRSGLLTTGAFLATHAHRDQTAPVKRGVEIAEKLLCLEPPPPPADLKVDPPMVNPSLTTRERFEQHRADPSCAACHALFDPFGMALETYDGIGQWRTTESGKKINAKVKVLGTESSDGDYDGAIALFKRLADSKEVRNCLTRQWFRFLFSRLEEDVDESTIAQGEAAFTTSGGRFPDLLVALTKTKAFRTLSTPSGSKP
jgi:hypothetical protein